jgi:hypothetical protein
MWFIFIIRQDVANVYEVIAEEWIKKNCQDEKETVGASVDMSVIGSSEYIVM